MQESEYLSPDEMERRGLNDGDAATLGLETGSGALWDHNDPTENPEPWMAPTDPPVVPGGRDNIMIADGFASSSDDIVWRNTQPGDEEITQYVRQALHMDAATTTLALQVRTADGVVYLHGAVQNLDDTDAALEIAARVPGVVDVIDEMSVDEMRVE